MEIVQAILGILFVLGLSSGGWIVWGVVQSRRQARELEALREREITERERLRLESEERIQERADRIYLDAVQRHTGELPPPSDDGNPPKF